MTLPPDLPVSTLSVNTKLWRVPELHRATMGVYISAAVFRENTDLPPPGLRSHTRGFYVPLELTVH